jgi:OOP family OmpA-OmpF porin
MENISANKISDKDELAQLRTLMLAPEQSEISELKQRLNDPKIRAEELSRVIAEAIVMRTATDHKLATALLPTIEIVLRDVVKKDPKFLAETMFPIIGLAIRKAISEALRSMVQSMNRTLEYAFSWHGILWRIESIRTGKPFAEIILLHTLIYRVEQLFLIHKETGLVLQHVAADSVDVKDADMVAAMLTAIQDFVNDSFSTKEDASLQNLNLGELTVWIEQGPKTLLAAVIRGIPPQELRTILQEILENIEFEYGLAIANFEGNAAPFEACKHDLLYCISQAQQTDSSARIPVKFSTKSIKQNTKKNDGSWVFLIIAGALCLIIIIAGIIFSALR